MAIKQTAGRDALGEFAPQFAQLNDDILFGEVWSREKELPARDRSLVTVTALMAQGLIDSSFQYHLMSAKQNGITRSEIAEILTHAAFYAGWPKAWAAFRMAKEIWAEDCGTTDEKQAHANRTVFPIGGPNDGFAQYFTGQSYLAPLSTNQVGIYRDAGTTGTSTTPNPAVVRSCSVPPGGAAIRNGDSPPGSCIPATWSTFRQASSTGTARLRTAGSPIWRWRSPVRRPKPSGVNRWTMQRIKAQIT